jgi:hypothetical protein
MLGAIALPFFLAGCGSTREDGQVIIGSRAFAGLHNPSTLVQAIGRFGPPSELFSPDGASISCYARWNSQGIYGEFVDWSAVGDSSRPPCRPQSRYNLVGVTLRGAWHTDSGLRIGDPVGKIKRVYPYAKPGECGYRPSTNVLMLRWVADPLGGPGSQLCTLGALISGGKVAAFRMSNRDASE